MKLPLRDFADVISPIKGPGQAAANAEKRGAARMTVNAKLNVYLLDNNRVAKAFSVLTRDISLTGVGLLQGVALSAKQNVILALPREKGPLFVICTVMHCRPLADGVYGLGCEFVGQAPSSVAEKLLLDESNEHDRIRKSVLN